MSVKYKHVDPSAPRMDPQIAMGTCLKPISTSLSLVIPAHPPSFIPSVHLCLVETTLRVIAGLCVRALPSPSAWFSCSTGVLPSTLPCTSVVPM